MALLKKCFLPALGFLLAYYFYSATDSFRPEMLQGKRVIVTGASTGIGEQIAYHLARMGAHLVVTARTEAKLKKVISECLKLGAASAHFIPGTMEDLVFAEQVVTKAEKLMGGLDMLILNHIAPLNLRFFNGDVASFQKSMDVNFFSYVTMTSAALPMLKDTNGSIVVVSSIADSAVKSLSGIVENVNPSPKEECALKIIKGGALRHKEIAYPSSIYVSMWNPIRTIQEYFISSNYNIDNITRNQQFH
ncbi:corticosteroid 11-beta-dehydrogenase isozyme 1 isoform X2 [Vombatus ursinus]|uniref:corticosteroid 11-beta-dehydrogenase isozyme 1 isoform X2 n=1 Tax=Vombatus ursinus TaxID=29139 RepID=UPI000FFD68B7|nr:corticosteroid 11-beta-dehydrogenase isozyme 1 isoform X2 [Vombatus ursinus]